MTDGTGARYRRGWVEWSRLWRPTHYAAVIGAGALATLGIALSERSGALGVAVFIFSLLVLGGLTPLADIPLLGPQERAAGASGHARTIWRAHVEGRKRAASERQRRHGKRPYN